ncbi:DUF4254 domain-containing protein [Ideonella livida]|uniref:DUF4254 domain-containing protein n=1 Tax=Ideonella livida TaxID=2707176 RepID=A0A7C9TNC9_9BURK|nr:DUF4254 domain-containing protein [Ideonella livida]NDY93723.1 DUF4254 domain-containing protein [Ideonella livida]
MTDLPLSSQHVLDWHDACLARADWPVSDAPLTEAGPEQGLRFWILSNHRFNNLLWNEEDLARRTQVSAEEIAANKRAIDRYNQARNDATERVDELLLIALGLVEPESARTDAPVSRVAPGARLNSETAGSMVDRLSIMALKARAMREQTQRTDVDDAHRASSQAKLDRLLAQRADLGRCLDELLADSLAGRAYFKVYRQFKMYNDPRLNPALVREAAGRQAG